MLFLCVLLLFFCLSTKLQQEELLEASSGMEVDDDRKEPSEVDGRRREKGKENAVVIEGVIMILPGEDRRLAMGTK